MSNGTRSNAVSLAEIEKSPKNISIAFGECLELCGLRRASDYLDILLHQEPHESFNEFIPNAKAFLRFQERFPFAVFRVMKAREWEYDRARIDGNLPQAKGVIRDYYNSTFVAAIQG